MTLAASAYALPPSGSFNATPITAAAGGTQAAATKVTTDNVIVGTVATAADSIRLPPAVVGASMLVFNDGANSMQVFGDGTETINGVATATGVAQASKVGALYACVQTGKWIRFLQG
jgi:hypothetical protein